MAEEQSYACCSCPTVEHATALPDGWWSRDVGTLTGDTVRYLYCRDCCAELDGECDDS